MTWHERKKERTEYYLRFVHGYRERPCVACAGSGRYDSFDSPPCGGCEGTGREQYAGPKAVSAQYDWSQKPLPECRKRLDVLEQEVERTQQMLAVEQGLTFPKRLELRYWNTRLQMLQGEQEAIRKTLAERSWKGAKT